MRQRAGRSNLGCLVTLLVISAILYFGVKIGEVYWRAYEFEDAMRQEVRFASQVPDERILQYLQAMVDTLGLPEEAKNIRIARSTNGIVVEASYSESVELPLVVRQLHFNPRVEVTY